MKRLILPGWFGSGPDHWQRIWAAEDPQALVVEQKNWDEPDLESWLANLHAAVLAAPGSLLVAHSLGVILVLHYVARHPDAPVAGALLVAPGDADLHAVFKPEIAGFAPVPRTKLPFPSIIVASHDDPHMELARTLELARDIGAEVVDVGNAGHVNVESGFGRWPLGRELAARLEAAVQSSKGE